ncbi:hypothetical protein ABTZ03_24545 [Kitasatospora sp. NPDC096077]|uniref:hypothetical protein n=1 Tax=Kitasatospora sp. NPDC096077 TaxID=3155544 RepID=UPI00332F264C
MPGPTRADAVNCPGTHCRRSPDPGPAPTAPPRPPLCTSCRDGLAADIREATRLYHECEHLLSSSPPGRLRERTTGGLPSGLPFNAAAAQARTDVLALLSSWSGLVAAERSLPAPARTATGLADFLLRQLPWLADHNAAGEACEDFRRVVGTARRAARATPAPQRARLGGCPHPDCPGQLTATASSSLADTPDEVACDTDPAHVWPADQWTSLVRQLGGTGGRATGRWLTAEHISRLFRTPLGTVYRLASKEGWRRHRNGHTYYDEADVHATFSARSRRAG